MYVAEKMIDDAFEMHSVKSEEYVHTWSTRWSNIRRRKNIPVWKKKQTGKVHLNKKLKRSKHIFRGHMSSKMWFLYAQIVTSSTGIESKKLSLYSYWNEDVQQTIFMGSLIWQTIW